MENICEWVLDPTWLRKKSIWFDYSWCYLHGPYTESSHWTGRSHDQKKQIQKKREEKRNRNSWQKSFYDIIVNFCFVILKCNKIIWNLTITDTHWCLSVSVFKILHWPLSFSFHFPDRKHWSVIRSVPVGEPCEFFISCR